MPSEVSELTLGQFVKLRGERLDLLERLAILCNLSSAGLSSLRYSSKTEKELRDAIVLTDILNRDIKKFFESDLRFKTPKEVTIMGKTIKVPQDLEKEPLWPSRKVKEIIQEQVIATGKGEDFDPTDKMADVIAHYLYVPFTGMKYNEFRADEFKEAIYDLPITVAVPLSNFFFLQWKSLYLTRTSSWLTSLVIWKKRLVLRFSRTTGT